MIYQITIMIDEAGTKKPRKVLQFTSNRLTAKDVKEKCLTEASVDDTKFTVKEQVLKLGNTWKDKEGVADDFVLTSPDRLLDYYLTLEAKV